MLFTREFKSAIRAGRVTRTYRCWKRPQARLGGRYTLAPDGIIEVTALTRIAPERIRDADARRAGFSDRSALLAFLDPPPGAELYQVDFRYLGGGRAKEPAQGKADADALVALTRRLNDMDRRTGSPWTGKILDLIDRRPATRAADLAADFPGWDTPRFKQQVRKLKTLGLTISLETGYELSLRGRQVLARIRD